jgi:hypothetical protein
VAAVPFGERQAASIEVLQAGAFFRQRTVHFAQEMREFRFAERK